MPTHHKSSSPLNSNPDPWARHHAWRYHPVFSTSNQLKHAFPGLGIATVAFTFYCIYDAFHHHHPTKQDTHQENSTTTSSSHDA
ncbi:hypothetical protein HMI55_006834 [Coelomomyces lativittatus]|nr:hypothetical protein HMI56_001377 [Coelomomyces lativittatus]KAJ1510820.1 hypothetical protein HMI55_006834 [Coelomomyces lativittatus]